MAVLPIDELKKKIDSNIYQNSQQAITGARMNTILNDMVDSLDETETLDALSKDLASAAQGVQTNAENITANAEAIATNKTETDAKLTELESMFNSLGIGGEKSEFPIEYNSGNYISADGYEVVWSSGFISNIVTIPAMSLVYFEGKMSDAIAPISKYDKGTYIPLQKYRNNDCSSIIVLEKTDVVFSGYASSPLKVYIQSVSPSVWNILGRVFDEALRMKGTLPSTYTDLNEIPINAGYQITNADKAQAIKNRPDNQSGGFSVYSLAPDIENKGVVLQFYTNTYGSVFIRAKWGDTWSNWESFNKYAQAISDINDKISILPKLETIAEESYKKQIAVKDNVGYVNETGTLIAGNIGFYSNAILLTKGSTIIIRTTFSSPSISPISRKVYNGYEVLVKGANNTFTYQYTAEEDMDIIVSGYSSATIYAFLFPAEVNKIVSDCLGIGNKETIEIVENEGYITENGEYASGAIGFYSEPIEIKGGTTIEYIASAISVFSAISKFNNGKYIPLLKGTSVNAYERNRMTYYVEEDMQVVFSGYSNIKPEINLYKGSGAIKNLANITQKLNNLSGYTTNLFSAYDNIVAIGDSLTFSQVYTAKNSSRQAYTPWAKSLARMSGIQYDIFAQAGDTSKTNWERYKDSYSVKEGKTIAVIYLCTNNYLEDSLSESCPEGVDYLDWADNYIGCYCKIIQTYKNLGANILLIRPWAGGVFPAEEIPAGWKLEDTNNIIKQIAERFDCAMIDAADIVSKELKYHYYPDLSGSNELHYNDLGYAQFASSLIDKVGKLSEEQMKYLIPK